MVSQQLDRSLSEVNSVCGPSDDIQLDCAIKAGDFRTIADLEEASIVSEPEVRQAAAELSLFVRRHSRAGSRSVSQEESQKRLRADAELLLELQLTGYCGQLWERFRDRLARYGFTIIKSWCLSGKIAQQCHRIGFGALAPPPRRIEFDDAAELALETVARALNFFENGVLRSNGWNPAKGATLRTYFIGACTHCFKNEYNRWCAENRGFHDEELLDCPDVAFPGTEPRPEARVYLQRLIERVPKDARQMLTLSALGYTHEEIAIETGLTAKAIERRLYKLRRELL